MQSKLVIIFLLLTVRLSAQSAQEKQLFKNFIRVCTVFKQQPLQLEIGYGRSANLLTAKKDSATRQSLYYIGADGAYVRTGTSEQIVTDSIALMVLDYNNTMSLTHFKIDVAAQVNSLINMGIADSSIDSLVSKYKIVDLSQGNSTTVLQITTRQFIAGTSLPVSVNTLTYNTANDYPVKVETIRRSLVNKSTVTVSALTAISIPSVGNNFLKEELNTFTVKKIGHEINKKNPVLLADRIAKNAAGKYVPVTAYKSYSLSVN